MEAIKEALRYYEVIQDEGEIAEMLDKDVAFLIRA